MNAEAPFDVPANLCPQAQDKSTSREIVDRARAVGGESWTAREGQRHSGGNPERRRRAAGLPREYEWVALDLRDRQAIEPQSLQPFGERREAMQLGISDDCLDAHIAANDTPSAVGLLPYA